MEFGEDTDSTSTCALCLRSLNTELPDSKYSSKNKNFIGVAKIQKLLCSYFYHRNVPETNDFDDGCQMTDQDEEVGEVASFSFNMNIGRACGSEELHSLEGSLELCIGCGEHLEKLDKLHRQVEELKKNITSHVNTLTRFAKRDKSAIAGGSGIGSDFAMRGSVAGKWRISQTLHFFQNLCSMEPVAETRKHVTAAPVIVEEERKTTKPISSSVIFPFHPPPNTDELISRRNADNESEPGMMEVDVGETKVFAQIPDEEPVGLDTVNCGTLLASSDDIEDSSSAFHHGAFTDIGVNEKDPLAIEDDENVDSSCEEIISSPPPPSSRIKINRSSKQKIGKTKFLSNTNPKPVAPNHNGGAGNKYRSSARHVLNRSPRLLVLPREEFEKYPAPGQNSNLRCSICHLTFKTYKNLKVHFRLHNADRAMLECHLCNTKCAANYTLRRHQRDIHGLR